MRFVAVKSAETQGRAVAFRTHQCLVRQRTQLINALRGHLAEFGLVAPKGPASLKVLETALVDETSALPAAVREMGTIYLQQIERLTDVIEQLAGELEAASKTDVQLRRLCIIPGIGPVTAGAIAAFAPDPDTFDSGRNFAAWLGLVPRQKSTGGKTRLGSVSKMGQTDIRRLLIVGAMSVIYLAVRKGGSANRWLAAIVARKQGASTHGSGSTTGPASACGPSVRTTSGPTTSSRPGPTMEGSSACSTLIDEFTRECLAIRIDQKLRSTDVINVLSYLFSLRGVPDHI